MYNYFTARVGTTVWQLLVTSGIAYDGGREKQIVDRNLFCLFFVFVEVEPQRKHNNIVFSLDCAKKSFTVPDVRYDICSTQLNDTAMTPVRVRKSIMEW